MPFLLSHFYGNLKIKNGHHFDSLIRLMIEEHEYHLDLVKFQQFCVGSDNII
jgi:hypothetical protein